MFKGKPCLLNFSPLFATAKPSPAGAATHANTRVAAIASLAIHSLPLRYVKIDIDSLLSSCPQEQRNQLAHSMGMVLRILRKQRRISQSQLANLAANMDRSYLSRLECGHVLLPVSKLLPLARALGLTAVILRFEDLDPRKTSKSPGSG